MTSLDEKRKTAQNVNSEILDARVIANYGDPGLDEDYHFDILSRYVVVMIESCYRILTKDKWFKMLAIVQRPRHLWIETSAGFVNNPPNQKRADANGNVRDVDVTYAEYFWQTWRELGYDMPTDKRVTYIFEFKFLR